jgi:nucleoside-diphosphate-sugar epimerase
MRILLTGATGFVGKQILKELGKKNVSVIPIVRSGKESLINALPNVERVISTLDLFRENEVWWEENCRNIDIVIHSAWYVQTGSYLQAPQNIDCLIGSLNLAKGAISVGVKKIVAVGTCFEYEFSSDVLPVSATIKPLTTYAATKAALFFTLSKWLASHSIDFSWCRLFYLYGDGEDSRRLMPYLKAQLEKGKFAELTSGNQIRDFIDVSDAGKLIANIALSRQVGPVNICSGVPVTVKQFAEQVADQYGRRDLLRFGSRPENLVDPPCIVGVPNYDPFILTD